MNAPEQTDVAIIGGGPAGATLGAYLARAGVDHAIFERERFPRPHVGESLVQATTRVFEEIGFLEKLDNAGFVEKRAAVWVPKNGRGAYELRILRPDLPIDHTFHVDRARFDQLLLEHAASLGSSVFQETRVSRLRMTGDRVSGVEIEREGHRQEVAARFVVDASGRSTVIGRQLQLKQKDPLFDQYAIYSYFEGVDRGPESMVDHIHIHFLPTQRGWAWQIPLGENLTSVGVVTERDDFRRDGRDREAYFLRHAHSQPELARRLRDARAVQPFRAEGDYSYSMRRLTGPGFVLTGDAARFVDPIFSSGVSVAVHSARFASHALVDILRGKTSEEEALRDYEAKLGAGIRVWYDFIKVYYKLQNLFTRYVRKPEYQPELVRLLQGEVYDADAITVIDRLRDEIRKIENTPGHLFRSALTDIPL